MFASRVDKTEEEVEQMNATMLRSSWIFFEFPLLAEFNMFNMTEQHVEYFRIQDGVTAKKMNLFWWRNLT